MARFSVFLVSLLAATAACAGSGVSPSVPVDTPEGRPSASVNAAPNTPSTPPPVEAGPKPPSPSTPPEGGPSAPVGAALNKPFDLRGGDTALLPAEGLKLVFEKVKGDSRCAKGVQCIWAGDAEVVLRVQKGTDAPAEIGVHTNGQSGPSMSYQGFLVTLQALGPQPRVGQPIKLTDYVATLVVASSR
jgi:hypothetical protein